MSSSRAETLRRLRQIAAVILDENELHERLADAVFELDEILVEIHGIPSALHDEAQRFRLQSPNGQVISPGYAISTMQDALRTAKYARGLVKAIEDRGREQGGKRVHVLYAGSGPHAPFFLLACLSFPPEQVGFTLLDIQETCCSAVRRVVDELGLARFVHDIIVADAAEYRHAGAPFQITILEMMQKALDHEPQVAVSFNLVPQMDENGTLIPEEVQLHAVLADPNAELEYRMHRSELSAPLRHELGPLFTLSKRTIRNTIRAATQLPLSSVILPAAKDGASVLTVRTQIKVYGSIWLREWESGLTLPSYLPLHRLNKPRELRVSYGLGIAPGLRFAAVEVRPRVSTP
jgi:hypothetical protein